MNTNKFYTGKVVLITGGSMGIGKELAKQVLYLGGKVAIIGRNAERLKLFCSELLDYESEIATFCGDVSIYNTNVELVNFVMSRFGKIDIVIANAGMSAYGNLSETSPRVVDELIESNVKGALYSYLTTIKELEKGKGGILFISSLAGLYGLPSYSLYSMTKMSLTALAQSLKVEHRNTGVYVGISYVGFTENETSKKTLSPKGQYEVIPKRNSLITRSRDKTAHVILKQIARSKFQVVHSGFGVLTYFLSRFFPILLGWILKRNYRRHQF